MNSRPIIMAVAASVSIAACTPSDDSDVLSVLGLVSKDALTAFFVSDWAPFETAAAALRNLDARYTVQQVNWSGGSSYSLKHGRVEYAHAAGLTGAGQIISVVDAGFLTSHAEFTGKTIYTPGGGFDPGVDDHGTSVASVAAGVGSAGSTIGVAPGASLQLGAFDTYASITAANNQAISLGAIVQNNSWGYELDATATNFNALFSGSSGSAYLSSIQNLAQNAVIVFAASNNTARTTSDIMAALPSLQSGLENSWITVVNAVPTFSGSTITSANVVSSGCLEAAAWCMVADGTVYAAQATGPNNYSYGTGTSFAAPQVAGAVALLAEAFPTLTAAELRARLLASADNNFFSHTGYVQFATGIRHGFSSTYGHGFLNLNAALLPIGGSYLPTTTGGQQTLNSPIVQSAGMLGNALSAGLAQHDLVVLDGLGTGFEMPASILSASAVRFHDPLTTASALASANFDHTGFELIQAQSAFSDYATGQELEFQDQGMTFSVLLPEDENGSLGVAVSRKLDFAGGALSFGLSAMREGSSFVGTTSLLPGSSISGTHGAASMALTVPVAGQHDIQIGGSFGVASPNGQLSDMSMSTVGYNSVRANYGINNVLSTGDRFSAGVSLPDAVRTGTASVALPVLLSNGQVGFNSVDIPLAAAARQVDISMSYGVPLSRSSEIVLHAVHTRNDGNIAGQSMTEAGIGFTLGF